MEISRVRQAYPAITIRQSLRNGVTSLPGNAGRPSFQWQFSFNKGVFWPSGLAARRNPGVLSVDGGGINGAGSTLTHTQVRSNTPDNCAPAGTVAGCTG